MKDLPDRAFTQSICRVVKTAIFIILTVGLFLTPRISQGVEEKVYSDAIAAVVNDEVITVYDVAVYAANAERQIRARYTNDQLHDPVQLKKFRDEINSLRKRAAQRLIEEKLIYAEFKSKGFEVPTGIVEKRIDKIVAGQAGGNWDKFEQMLKQSGSTLEEFRKNIRRQLAVQLYLNQFIDRKIVISPVQIAQYRMKHPELTRAPVKVHLYLLRIRHQGDYTKKIAAAVKALKSGKPFVEVAKQYSDGALAKKGGDMGWLKASDLASNLTSALGKVARGATSPPVELGNESCIVHIGDIQQGNAPDIEKINKNIDDFLFRQERQKRMQALVKKLRTKAAVRLYYKE